MHQAINTWLFAHPIVFVVICFAAAWIGGLIKFKWTDK